MTTNMVHQFELAGLGKAPFSLIGHEYKVWRAHPGAHAQPGTCCDYCGTGIMDVFWIRSADGRKFKVGCDCVAKVGDSGLKRSIDLAVKRARAERKATALQIRRERAMELLAAEPTLLTDQPHPSIPSKTLRDYVEWMMRFAGAAGKTRACQIIEGKG